MAQRRAGRLIKASTQWTPEQYRWLQDEANRLGLHSAAAVARLIVQAAMTANHQPAAGAVPAETTGDAA